nr:ribonuclease H-like domain-containing protein [Tanacetum cinerariifolium]
MNQFYNMKGIKREFNVARTPQQNGVAERKNKTLIEVVRTIKAMRVFNKRTRIVEEILNIRFLENTPNVKGNGLEWLFDIDYLTISMNYEPLIVGKQTNGIAGTKDNIVAGCKDSALVDGKKVIINEASIRCDLRLDDAEGTACLPNDAIFKGLARMGKHKPRRKQREATEVPHTEPQVEERVSTPSHDPLPSGEDRLQLNELMDICTKLSDRVLSLEQTKINQAAKIEKLKKRVKKLKGKKKRPHGLKRLYKVRLSARVESSKDEEDQGRIKDQDLFGVHDLDGDKVFVDVTIGENVEQDATVAKSVEEIKAAKPKAKGVTIEEPSESITTSPPEPSQPLQAKDKDKGIMLEPEKPLKKKDQIALDEEVARKLKAEMKAKMDVEERIAREKNEENRTIIK